jgi:hypothetical protein
MVSYISSGRMLMRRLKEAPAPVSSGYNLVKTLSNKQMIGRLRSISNLLNTDKQFRDFHEHETEILPEFYHRLYEHSLGPYASLLSHEERKPILVSHRKNEVLLQD